jgi:hypothetical protein
MYRFQQNLKNLKQILKLWNKKTFGNIFDSQKQLSEQMGAIQNQIWLQGLTDELKSQEEKLNQ